MVESKQHASQNESQFNLFCFEIAYHHVTQTGFKITIFQPVLSQYMDYRCVLLCFICFFSIYVYSFVFNGRHIIRYIDKGRRILDLMKTYLYYVSKMHTYNAFL